jgi:triosephosphate isomerase
MIYAANFKMNHTRATTKAYLEALNVKLKDFKSNDRVLVFPPATALDSYEGAFTVGAQNAYPARNGAYTGEIGLEQLDEFSITTILIGHSERREILGEDQEHVANKFAFFAKAGFEIVYCIGEPLSVREEGDAAVIDYLKKQFEGIDRSYAKLIVAYEPIWAIGTGRSATIAEITSTHTALKAFVNVPLLYGGSVKPDNVKEIVAIDGVDGVLVGSASLDAENFWKIVKN